jgi:hypothetical protein
VANFFKSDLDKTRNRPIQNLKLPRKKEVNTYYDTYIAEAEELQGTKKKLGKTCFLKKK